MTIAADLNERIAALPDDEAVTALAIVLEDQASPEAPLDPLAQREQEAHLREALTQPEVEDLASPDPAAGRGDLARFALVHLAETEESSRPLIEQAIGLAPRDERFDPTLLVVGALVLFVFRADINLAREPGKGWTFKFRTKGLSEGTIGKLLGQLMGTYLDPGL
jgi:hypothetical protein